MKKLIYVFVALIIVSCASAKLAIVPVGGWDYKITGTPNGDFSGTLTVTMDGDKYAASLKSQLGEIKFDQTQYDKKTKKLTGSFDFQGTPIDFESTIDGDSMKGSVSASGAGSWPLTATRNK